MTNNLNATGIVTIGRSVDGTGTFNIGDANLSGKSYDLNLFGGSFSLDDQLNVGNNDLSITARTGNITDNHLNTDIFSNNLNLTALGNDAFIGSTEGTQAIEINITGQLIANAINGNGLVGIGSGGSGFDVAGVNAGTGNIILITDNINISNTIESTGTLTIAK